MEPGWNPIGGKGQAWLFDGTQLELGWNLTGECNAQNTYAVDLCTTNTAYLKELI